MKKLLTLALIICATQSFAQIRHVSGIKAIDVLFNYSPMTKSYGLAYVKYISNKAYWKVGGNYLTGIDENKEFQSIGLDFTYAHNIGRIGEGVYINVKGGPTISMDRLSEELSIYDETGKVTFEDYSTLKYGVFAGLESEIFLSDKFVFLLGADHRYMFKSNFGHYRYFITAGIRFNL